MSASATGAERSWGQAIAIGVRRLAAVTAAGGLLGLLVGGVGGRLAMLLLARLNPDFSGRETDDGFTIGQFSGATFNLLFVATLIGVVGGAVYLVVRGLMFGPRWFQLLSISVGPAVVVGDQLVSPHGIDFTLDPAILAVAMFVLIPGVYAALLAVLAERWLREDSFFATARILRAALPLVLWLPILPVVVPFVVGLTAYEALRRRDRGSGALARPVWPWLARAALALIFATSLVSLIQDTAEVA